VGNAVAQSSQKSINLLLQTQDFFSCFPKLPTSLNPLQPLGLFFGRLTRLSGRVLNSFIKRRHAKLVSISKYTEEVANDMDDRRVSG
jgi:hypothetical protein